MKSTVHLAVDLGATSGRVVHGRVSRSGMSLKEIHRFDNDPVHLPDGLRWDVAAIHKEIVRGMRAANAFADDAPSTVGIDTWGVDYGLVSEDGRLLGLPFHHRDIRTSGLTSALDSESLYRRTGILTQEINTLVQLLAEPRGGALSVADSLLFMPDLFSFLLTGARGSERTIASTSQMLNHDGGVATSLLQSLGLPDIVPPLHPAGAPIGTMLPHVRAAVGADLVLTAVASHDTASAVAAIPAESNPFAFISCGTWALVGMELDRPVLSVDSHAAGYTNEHGLDGTYRFLRNVTGLWMLTESLRSWGKSSDASALPDLLDQAALLPAYASVLDPLDPVFFRPGDMPASVRRYCADTGQAVPRDAPHVVRCILDSLALCFAASVSLSARLSGARPEVVHIVGGGSRNELLCQATADATGLTVVAGPTEATAIGNLLTQSRAGAGPATLGEMRALTAKAVATRRYDPAGEDSLSAARQLYAQLGDRTRGRA